MKRVVYVPIKFKGSDIKLEDTNDLLKLLNELNKKISSDNVDMCDYEGMATEVIKVSEISNELSRRDLSAKEEDIFNKVTNKFDELLSEFGLFCYCLEGKDPKKRKRWEEDFAERHPEGKLVLTDKFFKALEKKR